MTLTDKLLRAASLGIACLTGVLAPAAAEAQARSARWSDFTQAFDRFVREEGVLGGGAVLVRDGRPPPDAATCRDCGLRTGP